MPGNPIVEAKRKKRSHSVASQCSIGIQGQHLPGSRRQSKYTLQEQHSRQDDTDVDYKQRRMVLVISLFAAGLFVAAVLLIVVTLLLTPSIDERSEGEAAEGCPSAALAVCEGYEMTLQAASTSQETCRSLGAKSFADKAVSTEDLRMVSPPSPPLPPPPQPPLVTSVVANELLRLETAINAMMAATEGDLEDFQPRRARSHSHHCFFREAAAVHPRRCRRSASAMIILQPKYGAHAPHPGCCLSPCSVEVAEMGTAGPSSSRGSSRKTRKKRRKVLVEQVELERPRKRAPVDPDELSKRARWTIVATACMLFFMCFLLVGITLRMTPIIDEMVRKENEQLMNSLNRDVIAPDEVPAAAVANDVGNTTLTAGPESSSVPAPLDQRDSMNISHPSRGD